jgi:hypothetical protein
MTSAGGRFLLLASGEFEPWAAEAERFALSAATGDGSVAILATASGREGESVCGTACSDCSTEVACLPGAAPAR